MKKIALIAMVVVAAGVLLTGMAYAYWCGGYGMQQGTSPQIENVEKFQKETLTLRDELIAKKLELRNEYSKPNPDPNRIATLQKEIVEYRTKIQEIANKYGVHGFGPIGGKMRHGMRGTRSVTRGCPMGCW